MSLKRKIKNALIVTGIALASIKAANVKMRKPNQDSIQMQDSGYKIITDEIETDLKQAERLIKEGKPAMGEIAHAKVKAEKYVHGAARENKKEAKRLLAEVRKLEKIEMKIEKEREKELKV
ncbi:TPA: hypothetical protein HA265_01530 [Candidatus Woesearchaeota archaeon]|nr:hypothetical protein [Candidatus Woesearchaeota archaeon]